jgi:hypothetical protein
MTNQGLVFLVHATRRDGRLIHYRTCDEQEARRVAEKLGGEIQIATK